MAGKKRKVRVEFRKNRQNRARNNDLTREATADADAAEHLSSERMSGKGDLTRYRTVIVEEGDEGQRQVSLENCSRGRVLSAIGLNSIVRDDTGVSFECSVRRVVRTMARDARNAVVTGDTVLFRPTGMHADSGMPQGVIERVEPRKGVVSPKHDNREHILAANVDQAAIVASALEPPLKLSLIDRFIVSCEKGGVEPLVCINKADLVPPHALDAIVRLYANLGYRVVPTSVLDRSGVAELQSLLADKTTVFTGQSGVGKSSLLNAAQPSLRLQTGDVSDWSMKGRHTTRRAVLLPLEGGGYVVDTPGIRQFQLWEVASWEVEGYFREFLRYIPQCRFPDCGHTHEDGCAVKQAVGVGMISPERYESYLKIISDDEG
jgi:ribosome biogenesis GTPase